MRRAQAWRLPTLACVGSSCSLRYALPSHHHIAKVNDLCSPQPSSAAQSWMTRPFFLKWSLLDSQNATAPPTLPPFPNLLMALSKLAESLSPGCRAQAWSSHLLLLSQMVICSLRTLNATHMWVTHFHLSVIFFSIFSNATTYTVIRLVYQTDYT